MSSPEKFHICHVMLQFKTKGHLVITRETRLVRRNVYLVITEDVLVKNKRNGKLQEGIGGSYRLSSLDRLAARQRLLEQNNGLGNVQLEPKNGHDGKNGSTTNGTTATSNNGGGIPSGVSEGFENFLP